MSAKLTLLMWWVGIALEATILFRALKERIVSKYPLFFVYLCSVFLSSASGYAIYRFRPSLYGYWYWSWEFVCVIAGYSVVLEIIDKGLVVRETTQKLLRNLALVGFAAIVGIITVQSMRVGHSITLRTSVEVERNLRTAEAGLLLLIVAAAVYYTIPIGRNLRGITVGYGLCVATIVIGDSVRSYVGQSVQNAFSAARSWSYLISLVIWTVALWAYHPSPVPQRSMQRNSDYEALAAKTRDAVESVRKQLEKVARQ